MRVRSIHIVSLLLFIASAALLFVGCQRQVGDNPTGITSATHDASAISSGRANVTFTVQIDPRGDPRGNNPEIRVNAKNGAVVSARLATIDRTNAGQPLTVFTASAPVNDGVANLQFSGLPLRPCTASLTVEGGTIGGYTSFRGSADLVAGTNRLFVHPTGTLWRWDLITLMVEQIILNPTQLAVSPDNLVRTILALVAPRDQTSTNAVEDTKTAVRNFIAPANDDEKGTVAMSALPREREPVVSNTDKSTLANDQRTFALALYQSSRQESTRNLVVSPISTWLAMAMVYAGAAGDTASQMATTLSYSLPTSTLHKAANWLTLTLAGRRRTDNCQLQVINALWGQRGQSFLDAFLDTLASNYEAAIFQVNFATNPEAARTAVNRLVAYHTENAIPQVVKAGAIDSNTKLALTSISMFKAGWTLPFSSERTVSETFSRTSTDAVQIPTMVRTDQYLYSESTTYQAVSLKYNNNNMSMLFILPANDTFATFESSFDSAKLTAIVNGLTLTDVELHLPVFSCHATLSLDQVLARMGMTAAFSATNANFSGMTGDRTLFFNKMAHETFCTVDEQGTGAGAAVEGGGSTVTGTGVNTGTGTGGGALQLRFNRPFMYVIRDEPTNTILYVGRCLDPNDATNFPPQVVITAPAASSTFTVGTPVPITVTATDRDGTVAKVEFFAKNEKLAEDTTDPFTYSWATAPVGVFKLTARATDNVGATRISPEIGIEVTNP